MLLLKDNFIQLWSVALNNNPSVSVVLPVYSEKSLLSYSLAAVFYALASPEAMSLSIDLTVSRARQTWTAANWAE